MRGAKRRYCRRKPQFLTPRFLVAASKSINLPNNDKETLLQTGRLGSIHLCTTSLVSDAGGGGKGPVASAHPFYKGLGVAGEGRLLSLWVVREEGGEVKVRAPTRGAWCPVGIELHPSLRKLSSFTASLRSSLGSV